MRDWAATLALVGGAEVIHFKGMIDDTNNSFLALYRGGRGRIHTCCWLPGACSTRAQDLLINTPTQGARASGASTFSVFYEPLDMPSFHSP